MTARELPEWTGKTPETAIPPRVKARIVLSQDSICGCGCGVKLGMAAEPVEFDHTLALVNHGENREGNLRALRKRCHRVKTRKDVAQKAVEARKRNKRYGFDKPSKTPMLGSRKSKWKKKLNGEVVRREA